MKPLNKEARYKIIETSNNEIIPLSELSDDNQKLVVFDCFVYFVCEKKSETPN